VFVYPILLGLAVPAALKPAQIAVIGAPVLLLPQAVNLDQSYPVEIVVPKPV